MFNTSATFKTGQEVTLKDSTRAIVTKLSNDGAVVYYKQLDSFTGEVTRYGASIEAELLAQWQS